MTTDKKRRRRTGCLTCRARRVRCDEGKPTCERCDAANIDCLGYEEKRHVDIRRPNRPSTSQPTSTANKSPTPLVSPVDALPSPHLRSDGLPLVALPSNPLPLQRPHARARDILAYHQFLFRTLPVLFRTDHLHFWRDRISQEAWEVEYLYDTILAIGGAHRAILMMSSVEESDIGSGVDNKVIAVQAYTRALQGLSEHLAEAEKSPELLVGALLLLTWFECLPGNFVAALRHAMIACHYYIYMHADETHQGQPYMVAIDTCFRNLAQIFRIILPYPNLRLPLPQNRTLTPSTMVLTPSSIATTDGLSSPPLLLQRLLDFASENPEIEDLIWSPLAVYQRSVPPAKIYTFQAEIRDWKNANGQILPQFDSDVTVSTLSDFTWKAVDQLPIPPRAQSPLSPQVSIISALYNFYMARTMWALSLLGHDSDRYEIYAYLYFYEVMQLAASIQDNQGFSNGQGDAYIARETLGIGLLPMLYYTAQCSPRPSWLRWTMEKLNQVRQEGLFRGRDLAKSLNALYTFEMCNGIDSPLMLDRFPPPASRVISVLIPAEDGQHYKAFYASPIIKDHENPSLTTLYHPLGHAQWSIVPTDESSKPEVEFYKSEHTPMTHFDEDWLLSQPICQEWITWSSLMDFNVDLLLRDHVSGCHLWPGGDFREIFRFATR